MFKIKWALVGLIMVWLAAVQTTALETSGSITITDGQPVSLANGGNVKFFINNSKPYFDSANGLIPDERININEDNGVYVFDLDLQGQQGTITVIMQKSSGGEYTRTNQGENFETGDTETISFGGGLYKSYGLATGGYTFYKTDPPPPPEGADATLEGYAPSSFKPLLKCQVTSYGHFNEYELEFPRYRYELWWDGEKKIEREPQSGEDDSSWTVNPELLPVYSEEKTFTFKIFAHTHYKYGTDSKDVLVTVPAADKAENLPMVVTFESKARANSNNYGFTFFCMPNQPPWYAYYDRELTLPIDVGNDPANKIEIAYHLTKAIKMAVKKTAGEGTGNVISSFGYWGRNPAYADWGLGQMGVVLKEKNGTTNNPDEYIDELKEILILPGVGYQIYLTDMDVAGGAVEIVISNQAP